MRIALDAMGGDDAPNVNVQGAINAIHTNPSLEIFLVGDQPVVEAELEKAGYSGSKIKVVPAEGFVGMDEKPTVALREKPNSSIAVCWRMMAMQEADAVISAGNTGAVFASGLKTRLFLKGIKRPGIAVVLPTLQGKSVLMDVGANPNARAEHLLQYGIMGSIYARELLEIESPRVGIMNIGTEAGKGNEVVREAGALLEESVVKELFIGNVEGRGLYQGEADVLICEGFLGNVVLKVSEGMADMMIRVAAKTVVSQLDVEKEKGMQAFQALGKKYQYSETGGAPLLGIDGVCLICHGSSDQRAISNAIATAVEFSSRKINQHITEAIQKNKELTAASSS